jgi:hypothetical protein
MALLENAIGGWTGGVLVGLGAALVMPSVWPAAGTTMRPIAKTLVRGALLVADGVKGVVAEASEQMSDLVAEVRAETAGKGNGAQAERHRSPSHH